MEMPATRAGQGSADAWVNAATRTLAESGLSAIKIEALARELGVTKGSFYWHFPDRAALIAAVIDRWEANRTDAIIAEASRGATAHDRLRLLVAGVAHRRGVGRGELRLYLEASGEGVAAAVDRVIGRRVAFLSELLGDLGFAPDEARRRSVIALSVAVGLQQLSLGVPGATQDAALDAADVADSLLRMLLAPDLACPPASSPAGEELPGGRPGE